LAFLCAAGCSSYASARLAPDDAAERPAEIFGTIENREFAKQVQVDLPAELVVAEVRRGGSAGRQLEADKRSVQLTGSLAQAKSTFSDVAPLFADGAKTFEALRGAASAQHADLMLITEMSERVEDRSGVLQVLNILILPAWLVPTKTDDLTLHLRAAVVDVRNGLVYATFEDHREERVHSPSASRRDSVDEGFDRLYAASLDGLRARVDERLQKLDAAPLSGPAISASEAVPATPRTSRRRLGISP
jgi:hypothetical protein